MDIQYCGTIFIILFIEYLIHKYIDHYNYILSKNNINHDDNQWYTDTVNNLRKIGNILFLIIIIILIIGNILYFNKKRHKFSKSFTLFKYLLGNISCKKN